MTYILVQKGLIHLVTVMKNLHVCGFMERGRARREVTSRQANPRPSAGRWRSKSSCSHGPGALYGNMGVHANNCIGFLSSASGSCKAWTSHQLESSVCLHYLAQESSQCSATSVFIQDTSACSRVCRKTLAMDQRQPKECYCCHFSGPRHCSLPSGGISGAVSM